MANFYRIILFFVTVISANLATSAVAQMPPSSLMEIPVSAPNIAGRLAELASRSGNAASFFRLKLAEAKLKEGNIAEAIKLAERADSKALDFWKRVVIAEAKLASGEHRKAIDLLSQLPPRPTPELSFGETFYANLSKRALLTLRSAKLAIGQDASEESAELAANFPRTSDPASPLPTLSAEQRMVRLHALVFANEYQLASNSITPDEIVSSRAPEEEKCRALFDLGWGQRFGNSTTPMAVDALVALQHLKCDHNLKARALYWIGKLGPAAQKDEEADKALTTLAFEYKGHRLQDDAFYMLYKRADRRGDATNARKYYNELMKLTKGDMRDKLAFEMAFPYYMKRDYERAASILEPLAKSEAAGESFAQVLYWYARTIENIGGNTNRDVAMKAYQQVASQYPFSFYAVLAAERAGIALAIPAMPAMEGKAPPDSEPFFEIIDALNRDGFRDAAMDAMDLAINLHPEWEKSHQIFITRKFMECGNYRKALEMAALHFDSGVYGPVEAQSDPMFAAFYPIAFPDAVARGYKLTGLPPGSIEGIMREESLFQPNVRSHAGAVGLMQLMPGTAAMVACSGAGGASSANLTNPLDNVLLGSSYLEEMRERFNGEMPLAIMAYNAGPGNVNKFIRNLKHLELDEFIENIPIDETRGYVKRVMRSQHVYAAIVSGQELQSTKSVRRGKMAH